MEILRQAIEYLGQGGWIMLPLGLCSLAMWMLIAERVAAFRALSRGDLTAPDAWQAVRTGRLEGDRQGLHALVMEDFLQERTGDRQLDRRILQLCVRRRRAELNRFLAAIAVLASVAPLLGLLGTVLGMIETFDVISIFGTGNAKAMAGGISVALVTTQSGLLVAIPGLLASGMLNRQSLRLTTRLEEFATTLDRYIRNRHDPYEHEAA
jgi:biopolymer transport protein ExbB